MIPDKEKTNGEYVNKKNQAPRFLFHCA